MWLVTFIYVFLLIISEFRLNKWKFLTSIYYATILAVGLWGLIIFDSIGDNFSSFNYHLSVVFLCVQIYSYICRQYLWSPGLIYRRSNIFANHHLRRRQANYYDFMGIGMIGLYIFISNMSFHSLNKQLFKIYI